NRETNFNKVFNSSPTVGVINPLAKGLSSHVLFLMQQKKKNDKSPTNSPAQSEASPVASPDPQRQEWFARYFTF
ncbi:FAM184A isoform 13, partial [Pan troglodytes]